MVVPAWSSAGLESVPGAALDAPRCGAMVAVSAAGRTARGGDGCVWDEPGSHVRLALLARALRLEVTVRLDAGNIGSGVVVGDGALSHGAKSPNVFVVGARHGNCYSQGAQLGSAAAEFCIDVGGVCTVRLDRVSRSWSYAVGGHVSPTMVTGLAPAAALGLIWFLDAGWQFTLMDVRAEWPVQAPPRARGPPARAPAPAAVAVRAATGATAPAPAAVAARAATGATAAAAAAAAAATAQLPKARRALWACAGYFLI